MDGTRKYLERGNSDAKGHAWYVFTNKWILATPQKNYRIPKMQFTEHKKVNQLKCPSDDGSDPLRKEKKAITSGKGWRER